MPDAAAVEAAEAAVDLAIRDWIKARSDGDDYPTGFAVVVASAMISEPNSSSYSYLCMDGQQMHVSLGLAAVLDRGLCDRWDSDD